MEVTDVYCMNQMASWVEYFYICNIFVLWIMGILWVLDITLVNLFLISFPLYKPSKTQSKSSGHRFQQFSMSKKLFVILLSQNLEPLFWQDVVIGVLNTRKQPKARKSVKTSNRNAVKAKSERKEQKCWGRESKGNGKGIKETNDNGSDFELEMDLLEVQ